MEKYIEISEENKKEIEEKYRKFYEDSRKKNKRITYDDLKHFLPPSLIKREWNALQQENKSYYLDLILPVQNRAKCCCELTGLKSDNLQIHHLDSYEFKKNDRLNPGNVIALCPEAHRRFHKEYGYKRCNRQQFEIYARDVKKGIITIYPDIKR